MMHSTHKHWSFLGNIRHQVITLAVNAFLSYLILSLKLILTALPLSVYIYEKNCIALNLKQSAVFLIMCYSFISHQLSFIRAIMKADSCHASGLSSVKFKKLIIVPWCLRTSSYTRYSLSITVIVKWTLSRKADVTWCAARTAWVWFPRQTPRQWRRRSAAWWWTSSGGRR